MSGALALNMCVFFVFFPTFKSNDQNKNNVKSINIQQYKAAQETTLAPAVPDNNDNKPMKLLSATITFVNSERRENSSNSVHQRVRERDTHTNAETD